MNYEIVYSDKKTVAGLRIRTKNTDSDMMDKIMAVWIDFGTNGIQIPDQTGKVYGVYCNYENGVEGAYDLMVGAQVSDVSNLPERYAVLEVPAGRYARFSFNGNPMTDMAGFWEQVWNVPLKRAYTFDYEEYTPDSDEIKIYIAIGSE